MYCWYKTVLIPVLYRFVHYNWQSFHSRWFIAECDNQYRALILIQGSMWSSGLVHWHLTVNLRQPLIWQSSQWAPVLRPKTSKILFGPVHFSVFLKIYIKINSRIWFGPVNSHFHFDWNGAHMSIICYKALSHISKNLKLYN